MRTHTFRRGIGLGFLTTTTTNKKFDHFVFLQKSNKISSVYYMAGYATR